MLGKEELGLVLPLRISLQLPSCFSKAPLHGVIPRTRCATGTLQLVTKHLRYIHLPGFRILRALEWNGRVVFTYAEHESR